jgi:hypothetical protein
MLLISYLPECDKLGTEYLAMNIPENIIVTIPEY